MLRIWVLVSGAALFGCWIKRHWSDIKKLAFLFASSDKKTAMSLVSAAMTAGIAALLFLQAGRLNLTVDFDSLWYGVRSHTMLDSGRGIYENLGTLGVVYTYSKGWEVLTLPLAGLPLIVLSRP